MFSIDFVLLGVLTQTVKTLQTDLHPVHGHRGQVVGVLLVPAEAEQRVVLRIFIDDGAVLQVPEVKHADGSIGSHRGKHISSSSCPAERDVINLVTQRCCSKCFFPSMCAQPHSADTHVPLCHEQSAGSSRVPTQG